MRELPDQEVAQGKLTHLTDIVAIFPGNSAYWLVEVGLNESTDDVFAYVARYLIFACRSRSVLMSR